MVDGYWQWLMAYLGLVRGEEVDGRLVDEGVHQLLVITLHVLVQVEPLRHMPYQTNPPHVLHFGTLVLNMIVLLTIRSKLDLSQKIKFLESSK